MGSNKIIDIYYPIKMMMVYQGFPDIDFPPFIIGLGPKSAFKTRIAMYRKSLRNGEIKSASVTMLSVASRKELRFQRSQVFTL